MSEKRTAEEAVRSWVLNEGFPLEFRTANRFREAGFLVRQSRHYLDAVERKYRELDVVGCTLNRKWTHRRAYQVVECKTSGSPWVVFTEDCAPEERLTLDSTLATGSAIKAMVRMRHNEDILNVPCFNSSGRVGFSCHTIGDRGGKNAPFDAVRATVSACLGLIAEEKDNCLACFPCIVLKGLLFEVYQTDNSDELSVVQVDKVRIHHRGSESPTGFVAVDVVTELALERHLEIRAEEMKYLVSALDYYAERGVPAPRKAEWWSEGKEQTKPIGYTEHPHPPRFADGKFSQKESTYTPFPA